MSKHFQQVLLGVLLGFVAPVVVSPIVAYILFQQYPLVHDKNGMVTAASGFWDFYFSLMQSQQKFLVFLRLCGLGNLPVFFLFMKFDKMSVGKGMLVATAILALIILILTATE